jgi:cation diffusion facilitator CzcD-associated flavoprotein CzcO
MRGHGARIGRMNATTSIGHGAPALSSPNIGVEPGVVVVVGGGPAGLAAADALGRAGVQAVVFERGAAVGTAWRERYDNLRLNTSRVTSTLPRLRYPAGTDLFPSRDEFVTSLERLVARQGIDVRFGVGVRRIDREGDTWRLRTSAGDIAAAQLVVATGFAHEPFIPPWAGRDRFRGPLLHSAEYRNAEPFRDRDVLVVGSGSSGMELAHDLASGGARRVWLSVRTPPNIVLRSVGGLPGDPVAVALSRLPARIADAQARVTRRLVLGDLSPYGLAPPAEGPFTRLRRLGVAPAVVDRTVIDAIKRRRIEVVGGVETLDAIGVRLLSDTRVQPDAIIAATGYRGGLETLVGHLGVLDHRGWPRVASGREAAPGLRFVGFVPGPGQIRAMAREARRAAREITRGGRRRPTRR